MGRRAKLGGFLFGVAAAVLAFAPVRALAYPPPYQKPPLSCFQPTGVNEESKEGSPYKGIRAWIALSPWTGDCIRVSSISAVKVTNLGDQVELSWSLGYAQANIGLGYDYFYSPELFEAWTPPGGSCCLEYNIQAMSASTTPQRFTIQDANGDTVWTPYLGSTLHQ